MAVNREYASEEQVLDAGDELALIPPVSGGSAPPSVRVSAEPLSLDSLAARVRDPRAGAVVTFSGVTREVERLDYEAYAEMAEERMAAIAAEAVERHGLCAAAVEHRVGEVPAVGAERDRGGLGAAPRRGVRRARARSSTGSRPRRRSGRRRSRAARGAGWREQLRRPRRAERAGERAEQERAQLRAVQVAVLEPVEDRAVDEPEPGARGRARLRRVAPAPRPSRMRAEVRSRTSAISAPTSGTLPALSISLR